MGSEDPAAVDKENSVTDSGEERCTRKNNKGKVPKRIHKAEREKLKREQVNELFLDLANALELTHPSNGRASILCEAMRLLKDLHGQIDCLKKEKASLLSESRYVTIEKDELRVENAVLQTQFEKRQGELRTAVMQSKLDLNVPAPEFHQGESLAVPAPSDGTLQHHAQAVFVMPFHTELQGYPVTSSNVSKPQARYPIPTDSWSLKLLEEQQPTSRKEVDCMDGYSIVFKSV